jgi:alpha-ketoglutarate-dependent taurine dioxygenase
MQVQPLVPDQELPLLAGTAGADGTTASAAISWAGRNRGAIDAVLDRAGALLVRGFQITAPEEFRAVCAAVRPDLRNYTGGDSPRTGVADQVYTSTEYPAQLEVLLHNELSYAGWSPDRLFFCCLQPAATGGETHLADGRQIHSRLDPEIRNRFEARGITYHQHLWDEEGPPGIGKSWQETFESTDRAVVEAYLCDAGMEFEWTGLGLRTSATHAAVVEHAVTGEYCWHNQADQWHRDIPSVKVGFGGTEDASVDPGTAGIESCGNHVTFGDGTEIDVADLMHIRNVSRACEVLFPWQAGDVLMIDNVSTMHGRKPFVGPRLVLAAMA